MNLIADAPDRRPVRRKGYEPVDPGVSAIVISTILNELWFEVASDPAELEEMLETQAKTVTRLRELEENESTEAALADLGRALGRHAELLRVGAHYESALNARDEAAEIWRVLGRDRAFVLAQLKGAQEAHLAASRDAWDRFDRVALEIAKPRYELYADFYHEFRGIALCREGRFVEALDDLEMALELRIKHGRPARQLRETRALISRAEAQTTHSS